MIGRSDGAGRDDGRSAESRDAAGGGLTDPAADPPGGGAADGARLWRAWRERVREDASLGDEVRALVDDDGGQAARVAAGVLQRACAGDDPARSPTEASDPVVREAASAIGCLANAGEIDMVTLQRLFAHLHEALFAELVRLSLAADGRERAAEALSPARVERFARRANVVARSATTVAGEAWFDAFGRTFRHDIKTPLQAASLNLELLMLESAENGLDTAALETIQQSLDRAVEMLRRFERTER